MSSDVTTAKDLRDRTNDELVSFVQEKSEELFKLRFQHYTGQLENTARLKFVKKEIARARTIISQRDQGLEVVTKARAIGDMDMAPASAGEPDGEDEE